MAGNEARSPGQGPELRSTSKKPTRTGGSSIDTTSGNSQLVPGDAHQFATLFAGYSRAYTICHPTEAKAGEKVKARYKTIQEPPTTAVFERHLRGKAGLTQIPLRDDDQTVLFAAIDYDNCSCDHAALEQRVKARDLPLIVCRSKSGGAHLYLFLDSPAFADPIREALTQWAADLGLNDQKTDTGTVKKAEIFPKQSAREPGKTCNGINLPYFDVRGTERYAVIDGQPAPFRAFLGAARAARVPPERVLPSDAEPLVTEEGGRNVKLTALLGSLRRQGADPDQLLDAARTFNERSLRPPLDEAELRATVKSVARYPSVVDKLNERYAYVLIGNKECVLEESTAEDGTPTLDFMSLEAFRGWHREFTEKVPKNGKTSRTPIATIWLDSPFKRKYRTVEFTPPPLRVPAETYNLFRGWAVEPNPSGDCSLFLDHLRLNVCQCDEVAYAWVLGWFAQLVQNPANKLGTSLALRGKQGVGKSKVGEVIKRLLGPYHFTASSPHQVTGHFNAHLRNCLLLQAEEAFWAGDKAAEGVLKDLITSDTLRIEFKGKDIVPVRNCIRLLVTSNADWVVPADFNDRRFTTLDVGEGRIKDFAFFKAMDAQLAAGGYGALMHALLEHEYDERVVRAVYETAAGREQKLHSLSDFESWIVDVATEGLLPEDLNGTGDTVCGDLHESYKDHAHRSRRILNATAFGVQLHKLFGEGVRRYRARHGEHLVWKYALPDLPTFRGVLLARLPGLDVDWDLSESWEPCDDCRSRGRDGTGGWD